MSQSVSDLRCEFPFANSATDSDVFAFCHDSEPPPPVAILHISAITTDPPLLTESTSPPTYDAGMDTRPPLRLMVDDTAYSVAYHIPITAPLY